MSDDTLWLDEVVPADAMRQLTAGVATAASAGAGTLSIAMSPMVTQSMAETVAKSLHLDLLEVLAEGWALAVEIRAYRDRKKHPPGTTAILRVGENGVKREIKPVIVIDFGGQHRFPVDVAVVVEARFRGIELSITDACITAVGSGECDVTLRPTLAGTGLCQPIVLKSWKLPGRRVFRKPVAIP